MSAFTPAKIKADLLFIASLIAVFGFKLPDSISVALIASAGLIAAALNVGDALLEKYAPSFLPAALGEVKTVESDVEKLLPTVLPVLEALPGKIGQEVRAAIEDLNAGPAKPSSVEVPGQPKAGSN